MVILTLSYNHGGTGGAATQIMPHVAGGACGSDARRCQASKTPGVFYVAV